MSPEQNSQIASPTHSNRRAVIQAVCFFKQDDRGHEHQIRTQVTCYEAFLAVLELSLPEKEVLINDTNCSREDAMAFCEYILCRFLLY